MLDILEPTSQQKQELFETITCNNAMRGNSLPSIDVHKEYTCGIAYLRYQKYNELLEPFVDDARKVFPKPVNWIDSIRINIQIRQMAQNEFGRRFGVLPPPYTDPNTIRINKSTN